MIAAKYARSGTSIKFRVPTNDETLDDFQSLTVNWIDPEGTEGSATGVIENDSYVTCEIDAEDAIAGNWTVWAEGVTADGETRATLGHKLVVKVPGEFF